ncbi:MAG: hypothetical protein ACRD10_14450, partial [Terriglobia bacterium]
MNGSVKTGRPSLGNRESFFSPGKTKRDHCPGYAKRARLVFFGALAVACWLRPFTLAAAPSITYVQSNYATPQTAQTAVNVAYR